MYLFISNYVHIEVPMFLSLLLHILIFFHDSNTLKFVPI